MKTKRLVVFGFGQRGSNYASFAQRYPEKFNLVAIIENDQKRRDKAKSLYPNAKIYTDYCDFVKAGLKADLVAVATQDSAHKEHSIAMMAAGYDLLLEKPIATTEKDCRIIYSASKKYNRKVFVCHVLRYTPFYSTVKNIIDDGKLGEIITINASENVGFYHQAHSFVRGPWKNKEESCSMILAKCCHDMDIIRYLMNESCLSVNSYGSLFHFKEQNAPENSARFCSDCPVNDCVYKAQKLYLTDIRWGVSYFTTKETTDQNILEDLKYTPYDRCVYKCNNNVVDHQNTIINFANGKTACHTLTAFSKKCYRDIKIHGTKAELVGNVEDNSIEIRTFGGDTEKITINLEEVDVGGHMGGDFYMMENLYKELNGEKTKGISYLDVSMESHLMCFAAEKSRIHNGKTVKIRK